MRAAVMIMVSCVGLLLSLGAVMLYSSTMTDTGERDLLMQLVWCGAGLVVAGLVSQLDYRELKRFWWVILGVALVMLVLVLIPHVGVVRGHARRWFGFKGFTFQPSEVGKVAVIFFIAWYGERYQRCMQSWLRGVLFPCAVVTVFEVLLFLEPDAGNAIVLAGVCAILLLLAGMRLRYFLPPLLLGLLAVGLFLYFSPMRMGRIYSWLHVEETKQDKGLQAYQAMVALGSGGPGGKGLGDSREKLGYLPEHQTDFIFAIIGEELGVVATLSVTAAFLALVLSGLYISWKAPDTFGFLLGSGLTCLVGLQAFVNIGVVTSALPNKGLPLPFISHGGSNLLVLLGCMGLLLSIARNSSTTKLIEGEEDPGDESVDPLHDSRANPFRAPAPAMPTAAPAAFARRAGSPLWTSR